MRCIALFLSAAAVLVPAAAWASETVTYGYDAKGRLVTVSHSGSATSAGTSTYTFDRADNRTSLTTTGSTFSGPAQRVVVTPLGGMTVIVLPQS